MKSKARLARDSLPNRLTLEKAADNALDSPRLQNSAAESLERFQRCCIPCYFCEAYKQVSTVRDSEWVNRQNEAPVRYRETVLMLDTPTMELL